jgi:hypothetical protein
MSGASKSPTRPTIVLRVGGKDHSISGGAVFIILAVVIVHAACTSSC